VDAENGTAPDVGGVPVVPWTRAAATTIDRTRELMLTLSAPRLCAGGPTGGSVERSRAIAAGEEAAWLIH
jgi:hypothetical protein